MLSGGEDGKINVWADHTHELAADAERSATVARAGKGKRAHPEAEEGEGAGIQGAAQHVGRLFCCCLYFLKFCVLIHLPRWRDFQKRFKRK